MDGGDRSAGGVDSALPRKELSPGHHLTRAPAPKWYQGCLGESCTRSLSDVSYPGWVFIGLNFATYWCQQMLYKYSHFEKAASPRPPPPLGLCPSMGVFSPNLTVFAEIKGCML